MATAPAKARWRWRRTLPWIFTSVLLGGLAWRFEGQGILSQLTTPRPWPLVGAILVTLLGTVTAVTDRWWRIVRAAGVDLAWREAWLMRMGGALLKMVTPLRSGELLRLAYLKRRHGAPLSVAVGVYGFEKLTAVLGLAPVLVIHGVTQRNPWSLLVAAGAISATVLLTLDAGRALSLRVARLFGGAVADWAEQSLVVFARLGTAGVARQFAYALLVATTEIGALTLCLAAAGVRLAPAEIALLAAVSIAGMLPVTAAGLGAREAALVLLFPHADPAALIAGGLWFFLVARLGVSMLGLFWMPTYIRRTLRRAPETA